MDEKIVGLKKPTQRKKKVVKGWGDEGFVGYVDYGCYRYKVIFASQDTFDKYVDMSQLGRCYGAICYDDQIILIATNVSEQLKRLTMWHELAHMLLQNNNINDGRDEVKTSDEGFTDTLASRIYEVTQRNPEMMRWLLK